MALVHHESVSRGLDAENTAKELSIPHRLLDVEITESAVEEDPMELQRLIYKIRSQGFRVAIDDFGAGQSNFKFLIDNYVDIIKLDKSFISHNCEDPHEQVVVAGVIHIAKMLGMTVVAEGVEEKEEFDYLVGLGVDLFQGYYLARPA